MEDLSKIYKIVIRISYAIVFIVVFVVGYSIYDHFFGVSKIVKRLEQNTVQLNLVIENNRILESKLEDTQVGIGQVHKSLIESQIKLTGLIKDTKGSTSTLREHAADVEEDLSNLINEIDSILTINDNDSIR